MRRILPALLLVIALAGCTTATTGTVTATKTPQAVVTPTPSPTPTSLAQGGQALKDAVAKLTPEQQDKIYLGGARSMVKTGSDAALIAVGHKVCDDFAAGVDMAGRQQDVVAAGYPASASLVIILSAGLAYCKAP